MKRAQLLIRIGTIAFLPSLVTSTGASEQVERPITMSVWDGVYSADQGQRGKEQYQKSGCAACHGSNLEGQGMAAALNGETFMNSWNARTVQDLFLRIQTTMPQDDPGSLTSDECRDIVAFLLQSNKFPPGQTDLGPDAAALKAITLLREKP
jgi:mono/diheme cytochrome c family protein